MTREAQISAPAGDPLRLLVSLALLLAFAWSVRCGVEGEEVVLRGDRTRREILVFGQPFPQNLVILVDASGSMAMQEGAPYALACNEAATIALQATDEGKIAFFTFGARLSQEPQGFIALPNLEAVKQAHAWLSEQTPEGTTDLVNAMEKILALDVSPLGIVVLSDGDPDSGPGEAARRITTLNAERKGGPAVIGIVNVLPTNPAHEALGRGVAEKAGGGFMTIKAPKSKGAER